ncbi:MAG: hypothetical protein Q9192_003775 [Flavoplaca navasiana]
MCEVNMRAPKKGGNCHVDVTCSDGNTRNQAVNEFNDPGIGPFTVTWTKKDDDCSDGLCAPFLALAYVGNCHVFDVDALSNEAQKNANSQTLCKVGCSEPTPSNRPGSDNICESADNYKTGTVHSSRCGVPAVGKNYGPGTLDSQGPTNDARYAPGSCGVHVVQHQKVNPAEDPATDPEAHCHLDITFYDNNQDKIGEVLGAEAPAGKAVNVNSKLPHVLLVTAQVEDVDPVLFDYTDQHWAYADVAHGCNFGQYDAGDREGDCGQIFWTDHLPCDDFISPTHLHMGCDNLDHAAGAVSVGLFQLLVFDPGCAGKMSFFDASRSTRSLN